MPVLSALLATLQQLQLELTGGVAAAGTRQLGTAKVAVVMPSHSRYMPPVTGNRRYHFQKRPLKELQQQALVQEMTGVNQHTVPNYSV